MLRNIIKSNVLSQPAEFIGVEKLKVFLIVIILFIVRVYLVNVFGTDLPVLGIPLRCLAVMAGVTCIRKWAQVVEIDPLELIVGLGRP